MAEIVYVSEIPSLRIHAKNINNNIVLEPEKYTLLLPHLHENFRNKDDNYVAISCFPPFPFSNEVEDKFCEYITENIKNSETKIIFDNVYEGHTISCIHGIYKIIDRLNLNADRCYFISGAMQAHEFYKDYCIKYNVKQCLNVIVLNSWERHVQLTMLYQDLAKHFPFEITTRKKIYLCFNRIIRAHRVALLGLLYYKKLVDKGYYSFFADLTHTGKGNFLLNLNDDLLSADVKNVIIENLKINQHNFPLILNNNDGSNTNAIYVTDTLYYKNSYFSLVTETFFFSKFNSLRWEEESIFFSEKIFKPIACNHPFILVSRPKSLEYLRKLGYKTFHPFIDESYDLIQNDEIRLLTIVNEVERLSKQTPEQWLKWLSDIKEIVEHNQKTLLNKSREEFQYIGTT